MIKDLNILHSDLILNSARILVLLSKFRKIKTSKMNMDKIMLLDFYMKFPRTMIEENTLKYDFDDFYSFYHWKPDRDQYNLILNYLLSKRLIEKRIMKKDFIYSITDDGINAISDFESTYYIKLEMVADYIKKHISKLSNESIEKIILEKSLKIVN